MNTQANQTATHKPVLFRVESNIIHEVLLSIGIPPNLLGYMYLVEAMQMILLNPLYLHNVTKGLYIDIARKYSTKPQRVERAIRHAINTAWLIGNIEYIEHIFKNCVNPNKGVPTNSLFLARLYFYISNMENSK
jgi:two-component system response regulator (stage 0 sporulation protein A)